MSLPPSRILFSILASVLLGIGAPTWADYQACQKSTQETKSYCDGLESASQAAKNAATQAAAAADQASGSVPDSSTGLCNISQNGSNNDTNKAGDCQGKQQSGCDTPCVPTQQDIQQGHAEAMKNAQQDCDAEVKKVTTALTTSAANLASNAANQCKTGNQSQSAPPMMPPQPPSPQQTPTPPTPPTTPNNNQTNTASSDCTGEGSTSSSSCVSQYVSQCSNHFDSGVCPQFSQNYCSSKGGSSGSSSGSPGSSGDSYNPGQGLTDNPSYCQNYLAQGFKCTAATNMCPSCPGYTPGATVPDTCADDPAYSNPNVAAEGQGASSARSAAGGAGGGSSSTPSVPMGTQSLATAPVAQHDGLGAGEILKKMNMSADGGGGGGGGSSSGFDASSAMDALAMQAAGAGGRKPASRDEEGGRLIGMAAGIQASHGPSLFSISSAVIRVHCQHGKLMHCGPK